MTLTLFYMPLQNGIPIGDSNLGLKRKKIDYKVFDFCGGQSPWFYGEQSSWGPSGK